VTPPIPSRVRPALGAAQDHLVMRLLDKSAWRRGALLSSTTSGIRLKRRARHPRTSRPAVVVSASTKADVEAAPLLMLYGLNPEAVVVSARRERVVAYARERNVGYGMPLAIEPDLAHFSVDGWETQAPLGRLPYAPTVKAIYDQTLLRDTDTLRGLSAAVLRHQRLNGADRLLAGWIGAREVA